MQQLPISVVLYLHTQSLITNKQYDDDFLEKIFSKSMNLFAFVLKKKQQKNKACFYLLFIKVFYKFDYADSEKTCFIMLYSALVDQNEPQSEYGTIWKVKIKSFTQVINQ